jgi:hypothetical protein
MYNHRNTPDSQLINTMAVIYMLPFNRGLRGGRLGGHDYMVGRPV